MGHHAGVNAIPCLLLLCACFAAADETADRVAIDRTIAALKEPSRRTALFTQDADASAELVWLPKVKLLPFPIPGPPGGPGDLPRADGPTVTISKEPWGEVIINFPWMVSFPAGMRDLPSIVLVPLAEIPNPQIVSSAIRFITPDVALADGDWIYDDGSVIGQYRFCS